MDYEYDDDRPTDRADELDNGEQMADTGLFADEFVFEAPDLATAFLAALDAVDDRRFVTPPPDILAATLPTKFPPTSPASEPAATGSESIAHDTIAHESIAPESIAPESIAPDSTIAALEAGTLALPGLDDPADEQA